MSNFHIFSLYDTDLLSIELCVSPKFIQVLQWARYSKPNIKKKHVIQNTEVQNAKVSKGQNWNVY